MQPHMIRYLPFYNIIVLYTGFTVIFIQKKISLDSKMFLLGSLSVVSFFGDLPRVAAVKTLPTCYNKLTYATLRPSACQVHPSNEGSLNSIPVCLSSNEWNKKTKYKDL